MSKLNETGHAKNVANFETLITFVTGYGSAYNPSNPAITVTSLQAKAAGAKATIENLNNLFAVYSTTVGARQEAFEPLNKLSTRIFNALKATSASQTDIDSAETNHRKLQGRRASAKFTEAEKQSLLAEGKVVNQISASQQSFDSRLDVLDKQIKLLTNIAAYAPNEAELQLVTLINLYNNLLQYNRQTIADFAALSSGRVVRDNEMYNPETGMVALAYDAKNYAKSVFGIGTPQFKQISALPFTKR